ncbi:uncharacterized protein LOC122876886 isoform X2 [Siniperca chuatsi]|uniref:uncharacterized protein LOC122876886 isoform X2 n=1 Tax=Siniperca chuatsi TaxID=119488 RepID=UPI001CE1EE97|nr:uncharacterized protein LOC122876886 isoform X2 [Siniperca chuatsi]
MKSVAGLALLLVNVRLSHSCFVEGPILFCLDIPPAFRPGYSSLVMVLKDVGEINSTVLRSDNLSSVTRLRLENAGVTGIAEGAFSSFQNLTNLSLNQNLLTEMNPNWFGRPDILSELTLTKNLIKVLNESMLNGLVNLTTLSLNRNRITTIDPNSFSSQTILADLDLSENRMTRVSPQVFRSLRSTRIRLDGNPWDCSCGAEDFVDFLKDLQSRSLLDRQMEVTCQSPPSLRGRPVWNVSVCVTSLPPSPTSVTQTVHPKPTTVPALLATPPARPASEAKTSVQPRPTDIFTTVTTPTLKTETCATSRPSSDANIVCTLVVVIVVLSLLLFAACFLVVLHRRKRNNKAVMPGRPNENRNELKEDSSSSSSSHAQSPAHSEKGDFTENNHRDSEMGWRRSFNGVRAKSANAVLFMSPFCAPVKDQVTLQNETQAQSKDTENQPEGKQKLGNESEADGGIETENLTNITDVNAEQAADGRNLDKDPRRVSVNTDAAPYLSIGTNQNKPNPDDFNQQSTDGSGQRSQTGKVMGRISTWPLTAIQWQAKCKMEEEEGCDVLTVWTPKFPGEGKKVLNKVEHPSGSDRDEKEEEIEKNQIEDSLKMNVAHMKLGHTQSSKPNDKSTSFSEAHACTVTRLEEQLKEEEMIQDPATVRQTISETQNLNQEKLAETPAHKNINKSSNKAELRNEAKRAATGRQRAENRSTGSKAPSGGASPDDKTLLSGNVYALDLLHEVVQNNGRWTRERWKQMHVNKRRR